MFRLAHLSDPHLPMLGHPRPGELLSKRLIGYINWARSRKHVHRGDVAAAIIADLKKQTPDHIAMTGDLVHVAANRECEGAQAYMAELGAPEDVSAVPGNHDAYVGGALVGMAATFAPYVSPDATYVAPSVPGEAPHADRDAAYPFVRRRGNVAIIGISTALPTAPFMAGGKIGPAQRERLANTLQQLSDEPLYRILLIHHPPTRELARARRGLSDTKELAAILQETGVDVILHGHNHTATLSSMPGPERPIPIVGVPSASAMPHKNKPGGGYAMLEIEGGPAVWQVTLVRRGLSEGYEPGATPEVVELSREALI